jgi:hypothetical protein
MEIQRKLGILSVGLSINWMITWGFDLILYPSVIYFFGILWGSIIMIALSFLICYATIIFYDITKKDWIGIESIKGLKELNPDSRTKKLVSWIAKKSDPVALVLLSIHFDPFITVAYMRHGAHKYNGLSKRDWVIFIISLAIGNLYWIFAVVMGLSIIQFIGHLLGFNFTTI